MKRTFLKKISLLLACLLTLQLAGCAAKNADPAEPEDGARQNAAPALQTVDLMANVTPAPAEPAAASEEASTAAADFALRLFRAACDGERNTLISPLSVLCALAMTENGAESATLTQMESTLGLRRELWNAWFRAYRSALSGDDALKMANSVWFTSDGSFAVNPDFLQANADFFGADVYEAPFDEGTLADINAWVSEKTDGMIPAILDRIPDVAVMYLINALAFDASWQEPYYDYSVVPGEFICLDGTKRSVDFMNSDEGQYLENDRLTGFIKPYEGGKYAFAALLPKEGVSIEDCLAALDGAALRKLLSEAQDATVYAALPKFETEYGTELSEVLKSMGMEIPFDGDRADFSGMAVSAPGNLYIGRVLHKTFLSVAEDGTRAGAATAVEILAKGIAPRQSKEVRLDRPFLYMLVDTETNLPFFIGAMLDPA